MAIELDKNEGGGGEPVIKRNEIGERFIGAIVGLVLINLMSLGASYFLLKARNRFK